MIDLILNRLTKVQSRKNRTWMACCPAHDDKTPSLAIKELPDGRILMKCFAGCEVMSIMGALKLSVSDLFPEHGLGEYRSFVSIERDVRQSKQEKYFREKVILAMADSDRENGKRLSPQDMETERKAYLTLRNAGILQ